MLTYLRWMCLVLCYLAVAAAPFLDVPEYTVTSASLAGAVFCAWGLYSDRHRDMRMRATEEELGHYRSEAYRKFRLNQRSRAL